MATQRSKPDDLKDAGGGRTKVQQGGEGRPRLPHERDESSDSQETQGGEPPEVGKTAHEDVERGVVDTDRGPEADRVYRETLKKR